MTMLRFTRALALASLAALYLSGPAVTQDATPPAGEPVPGSECTLEPRSITFLGELVATPLPSEPYEAPAAVPEGEPVDDETRAGIEAAVRQIVACSNSGDILRALAIFGDDYLRRTSDPTGELDPATADKLVASFATPVALTPDMLITLVGIREMVALPDGRVAVVVETYEGPEMPEDTSVDLFIFEKVDGGWIVVDAVNDIDEAAAGE